MKKRKPGKWLHSKTYEDVEVAHDEHLALSVFWNIAENDRAFMVARKRAKGTMEAWENLLNEEAMEKASKKGGGKK